MTRCQAAALRELVSELEPEALFAWLRHQYRLAAGIGQGASTVAMLAELGCAPDVAAAAVDERMSERLDRSAGLRMAAG